ncbi:methyltransferase domain-containing protein [Streptomyces sp. BG9H]|uniref:Methyltransferase domain-containing protein n=2 Tax=Streptomyces anatolicus TaxID=2675858 RepID=A0ABS6YR30_9ACTN|nr:methyltransferase domain-containing protein [Streptomyces anatolicus]
MSSGLNDRLFRAAAIGDGDRVLDIGCGAGDLTRTAARLAGRGHAVGVDISAPLLERARARTSAEGVKNVTYEKADAQTHVFPAGGYDVAISRGGVMFFADHAAAFSNIARALRPGGRLAFACPQAVGSGGEEAQAFGLLAKLLAESDGEGSGSGSGDGDAVDHAADRADAHAAMASLSDPDRIREALVAFDDVTVTPLPIRTYWGETPADAVDFMLSRPPGRTVAADRRAALEDVFRPYATDTGVRMRASVWLVTAVRQA